MTAAAAQVAVTSDETNWNLIIIIIITVITITSSHSSSDETDSVKHHDCQKRDTYSDDVRLAGVGRCPTETVNHQSINCSAPRYVHDIHVSYSMRPLHLIGSQLRLPAVKTKLDRCQLKTARGHLMPPQQRLYHELARRADYSIFAREWTHPPAGESMNGLPRTESVLAYGHRGWRRWPTASVLAYVQRTGQTPGQQGANIMAALLARLHVGHKILL